MSTGLPPLGKLCASCLDEAHKWLDFTGVPSPLKVAAAGDRNARAVAERRRLQGYDHRRLVRTQLGLIYSSCMRNHHREGVSSEQ